MKIKIAVTIALVLSVTLLLLTGSDSRVEAQNQSRIVADTGVVTLGPNQILRLTVDGKFGPQTEAAVVRFRRMDYAQTVCGGGICKLEIASQTTTNPINLAPGEAIKMEYGDFGEPVRVVVLSSSRNVRVNVHIVDATTGNTVSLYSTGEVDTW